MKKTMKQSFALEERSWHIWQEKIEHFICVVKYQGQVYSFNIPLTWIEVKCLQKYVNNYETWYSLCYGMYVHVIVGNDLVVDWYLSFIEKHAHDQHVYVGMFLFSL